LRFNKAQNTRRSGVSLHRPDSLYTGIVYRRRAGQTRDIKRFGDHGGQTATAQRAASGVNMFNGLNDERNTDAVDTGRFIQI